jgi:CHAT domain-containing protein
VFDFHAARLMGQSFWKSPHYLAFIVFSGEPDNIRMIDLGEVQYLDETVISIKKSIIGGKQDDTFVRATKRMREMLAPIFNLLGASRRLLISPDGELTCMPFEMLPVNGQRFLIDDYKIYYLSASRDLLRSRLTSGGPLASPIVAAAPNFDLANDSASRTIEGSVSGSVYPSDLKRLEICFDKLPNTRLEGKIVASILGITPWIDDDVVESRLKNSASPRFLHLATHGFFLFNQTTPLETLRNYSSNIVLRGTTMVDPYSRQLQNPLMRSGLALAGANTWLNGQSLPPEAEDGILTALDITGLDLVNTKLVVLSHINSSSGDTLNGESVLALRRAFVLSGAETLVMSLWTVPDKQLLELIIDLYANLMEGKVPHLLVHPPWCMVLLSFYVIFLQVTRNVPCLRS